VVFLWGVLSGRLEHDDLTAPIVFIAVGGLFAAADIMDAPSATTTLKPLVEVTLVWVLFSDAAGVPFGQMRHDLGRILRLLAVGLPLTVLAGWALATWFFPSLGIWLALLVRGRPRADRRRPGAAGRHQPSRAAESPQVNHGGKRIDDGIVTPIVMVALAGAASAEGIHDAPSLWAALAELGIGVILGVRVRRTRHSDHDRAGRPRDRAVRDLEPHPGAHGAGRARVYRGPTRPRDRAVHRLVRPAGLASLVFALLALEELGTGGSEAIAIIGLTVLVSVLAHGLTAGPLASRYGRFFTSQGRRPAPRPEIDLTPD
jgi:hypothetical protein